MKTATPNFEFNVPNITGAEFTATDWELGSAAKPMHATLTLETAAGGIDINFVQDDPEMLATLFEQMAAEIRAVAERDQADESNVHYLNTPAE